MWKRHSHIFTPFTNLTNQSPKCKLYWGPKQQQAFDQIKQVLAQEVMLSYPDFSQPFDIHIDASDLQLGAIISQNNKPIAFFSRTLNPMQQRYTIEEHEMLSLVETLIEFWTILLGRVINVCINQKNHVNPTTNHASNKV